MASVEVISPQQPRPHEAEAAQPPRDPGADVTESAGTRLECLLKAPLVLRRVFAIPWRNRWFWCAVLAISIGFAALNTRYHSLVTESVAEAVPFDGRFRNHFPREYGWPWSAVRITTVYDGLTMSATSVPLGRNFDVLWIPLLGNVSILVAVILIVGRSYAIAAQQQTKGIQAALPFRFTLRSLFIVLTILGVWLGATLREAAKQKRVLDELRAQGAEVAYEYENHRVTPGGTFPTEPPLPWLRGVFGEEWGLRVLGVDFQSAQGDPVEMLTQLAQLNGVESLRLSARPLDDVVDSGLLVALQNLPDLRRLDIAGASEAARRQYRQALPNCTIIPYEGLQAYVEKRRHDRQVKAREARRQQRLQQHPELESFRRPDP